MRGNGGYGVRWAGPPGWRRIPPVTRAALALAGASYLAGVFRLLPMAFVAADPRAIVAGEVWRLFTYPFAIVGILNALFGLFVFWAFGCELEAFWGSRRFASFLLAATMAAGLLGTGLSLFFPWTGSLPGYGLSGVLTAMIVAWALLGPSLPANLFGVLPMTRKVFAILAVVVVVFGELETSRSPAQLAYLLGGLPVAWVWVRGVHGGRPGGSTFRRWTQPFRRRRFRVVDNGRWGGPVN